MNLKAIILAAGKGTRMNSMLPKVLHNICGAPLIHYAVQAVEELEQYTNEDHSEQSGRIPDFRNVLYWNPDAEFDTEKGKVSFYTSDYEGMYEVIVRGVNRNGEFSLGTTSFTVSEK